MVSCVLSVERRRAAGMVEVTGRVRRAEMERVIRARCMNRVLPKLSVSRMAGRENGSLVIPFWTARAGRGMLILSLLLGGVGEGRETLLLLLVVEGEEGGVLSSPPLRLGGVGVEKGTLVVMAEELILSSPTRLGFGGVWGEKGVLGVVEEEVVNVGVVVLELGFRTGVRGSSIF
ncbi:hypothetical protein BDD12DRAFT_811567 [Trichophaea hybrida]|nr:hypothetical protein BDD12DRAFT_811567 [Trichophaea hybrida]